LENVKKEELLGGGGNNRTENFHLREEKGNAGEKVS